MKIKILTFILILALAGVAIIYDEGSRPEIVTSPDVNGTTTDMMSTPVPPIKAITLGGKEISISAMKEDVILLHFWAEWCSICYAEFPDLLKLVAESHGRIGLLAVSMDGKREDAQKLVHTLEKAKGAKVDNPHIYWIW